MNYIDTFNEKVVFVAQTSRWIYSPSIMLVIAAVLTIPEFRGILFFGAILWFLYSLMYVLTTELGITDKRVVAKWGFISRQTIELRLDKIESVRVNQSIFGRVLNYGDIIVIGSGSSSSKIPFIQNPVLFRQKLDEIIENRKDEK